MSSIADHSLSVAASASAVPAPGSSLASSSKRRGLPRPADVLELLKPVTWFPPMWALACGVVAAGVPVMSAWKTVIGAVLLAGPLVCGTSQAVNDWFDRHVDAINEPKRPIPSGRIAGRMGLYIAIVWSGVSLLVGAALGKWVFLASVVGLVLAWAYSAPPLRLKMNGWLGCTAVALCYEGLPWFTGAAALGHRLPDMRITYLALLYSAGAVGIMVLNDFKAIEGDEKLGVRTLPVQLGVGPAALLACVMMAIPQVLAIAVLVDNGRGTAASVVTALLSVQILFLMPYFLRDPRKRAPLYNATGTSCYVAGMLVSAFAMRALIASGH